MAKSPYSALSAVVRNDSSAVQPRSKPRATRLGRPSSASRKSTSAGCQLKRRLQPRTQGPPTNGNSQSKKQSRLPVQPSACPLSSASLRPQQQALPPAPVPLNRSALAAVPNAIDVDPLEYMLDAFDNCISHILVMPTPMQTSFAFASTAKCCLILLAKNSPPRPLPLSKPSSLAAPAALRVLALHRSPVKLFKAVSNCVSHLHFHFQ